MNDQPILKNSKWQQTMNWEPRDLRNALGRFATGIAVVTTTSPRGKREGLTINSFASVSLDPPLILWSLKRDAPSLPAFAEAGRFSVNILSANQRDLSNHFSTPHEDKFENIDHHIGDNGCPCLTGVLAHFECKTVKILNGGDHAIFLGHVCHFEEFQGDPLIFSAGQYCQLAAPEVPF